MKYYPELFPPCFQSGAMAAAKALGQLDDVLIAGHVNPDGDALGSMAAAGFILKHLGKRFTIYIPGGVPHYLEFLRLPCPVCPSLADLPFKPQGGVYVDCSEAPRLGEELAKIANNWPTVNIDHHICEKGLGSLANFIETKAAATCQLMAYVALSLNMPLAGDLAEAIGLGIISDTGQFTHGNSSPEIFVLAAALEIGGLSIPMLGDKLRSGLPLRKLYLWGRLFERIKLTVNGQAAWCAMLLRDLEETGSHPEEIEGFVDWLRNINGVQIGILVKEVEPGKSKFSLRSRGDVNVQIIAAAAGGGGHKNAAGGSIPMPVEDAAKLLISLSEMYLAGELRD